MSKDRLMEDNKKKLHETALRLGISEDAVLSQVPRETLFWAQFNDKILGGFLKRMEPDMTPEKVLQ